MKYNIGDKVLIRNDLKVDNHYGGYGFNSHMNNFKNKFDGLKKSFIAQKSALNSSILV